jgi:hypothetical protein
MRTVTIIPLPRGYLKVSKKFWQTPPPTFPDGPPTPEEIELARALFLELDPESQDWYSRYRIFDGLPRKAL